METHTLVPHPDFPPVAVRTVTARIVSLDENWLCLRWRIEGAGRLAVPKFAGKGRADGLWRATCFELFAHHGAGGGYVELNLSPSERWAAYDFTGYRAGMSERAMPRGAVCTLRLGQAVAIFDGAVPAAGLPPLPWRCGLSAVIEEEGGALSYWALRHGEGAPDFHNADCHVLPVAAPDAP